MGYDIRYIGQSEREMAAWIHECESSNKNGPLACTPFEEDQNKRKFNPNADEITKQEITKDMKMILSYSINMEVELDKMYTRMRRKCLVN